MQFAARLAPIQPSMTLAINTRSQEMRSNGIDVINVSVGEPDFPTPAHVKKAAIEAIEENFTRYTPVPGIPALRSACARYFERNYHVAISPDSIIVGAGGKQCLYTFMQTWLNPGDEAILPAPYWVSYPDMIRLSGASPAIVPATVATGFKVTPEMLESKRSAKTRLLILNSPNNPTGAVYSRAEFGALMEWALGHDIFVLSDEIYDQLVYPPATMTSAIGWFAQHPDHVAVVNGLSKSYAMTGWRVGYLAGAPELIKKMTVLQGHMTSNVCSIAQKAALAALDGPDACVEEMRADFLARRDHAVKLIGEWQKAICPVPDGAFYLFVDVANYYKGEVANSLAMCQYLLEKAHVAAVPGAAFGDDRCIRLSYAISEEMLTKALRRMGQALAELG